MMKQEERIGGLTPEQISIIVSASGFSGPDLITRLVHPLLRAARSAAIQEIEKSAIHCAAASRIAVGLSAEDALRFFAESIQEARLEEERDNVRQST